MLKINWYEFKNIGSYGNQWSRVDIKPGITYISGEDNERNRSNGSGKTSVVNPIAFGLYGESFKNVTKARLVNWKNKKGLEVKINFTAITGDDVTIHRGIKPSIFDVYVNSVKLETTSSVIDYQSIIEETYIGMDFKIFYNIVYSNPNNSISLLNTKKEQKRAFLERIFNCESYSQLLKVVNEKIKAKSDYLLIVNTNLFSKETLVNSLSKQLCQINNDIEEIDNSFLLNEIKTLEAEINTYTKNGDNDSLQKERTIIKDAQSTKTKELNSYLITNKGYEVELDGLNNRLTEIGDLTSKREFVNKVNERIKELEKTPFEKDLSYYESLISEGDKTIKILSDERCGYVDIMADYRAKIDNLPTMKGLDCNSTCSNCGHDVDYKVIKEETEKKKEEYSNRLENLRESISNTNDNISKIDSKIAEYKEGIKATNTQWQTLEKLRSSISSLNIESIEKEQTTLKNKIAKLVAIIATNDLLISTIGVSIDDLLLEESKISEKIQKNRDIDTKINELQSKISVYKNSINISTENIQKWFGRILELEQQLDAVDNDINDLIKDKNATTLILDYFFYIKNSLKDENVKQYAISSILPILNKQTNHYLSETGQSFYVLLDSWMEAEIKGIGIDDCSFGNLSGGESKSLDLSIKFACIDIARMMNTADTNVLILDELLDSSVDDYGIQQLMDIVRLKQTDGNLAIFLISHRESVADMDFDNYIKVYKEDGFTRILE